MLKFFLNFGSDTDIGHHTHLTTKEKDKVDLLDKHRAMEYLCLFIFILIFYVVTIVIDSNIASAAGKICVSISGNDMDSVIAAAKQAQSEADILEIRLDGLKDPDPSQLVQEINSSLLFTNRPVWEGGNFAGEEDERLQILRTAVQSGAQYVDIEMKTGKADVQLLLDEVRDTDCKVIISWHNFKETPSREELEEIFDRQRNSGAHIGKIVTMAHDFTDVLRVLQLQEAAHEKHFPLSAFCMGQAGVISRLATLQLGGFMTYAAPESGKATAPGQLTVSALKEMLQHINGS